MSGNDYSWAQKRLARTVNPGDTNSILNKLVAELRNVDIQKDSLRSRHNVERIGEIMAYEISKEFHCSTKDIQPSLGIAPMNTPDDQIVISTILCAGPPFHQGFLRYLDNVENALVSTYRKYKDRLNPDIHIEHIASPRLTGKTLVISDPMLVTGNSMELAYKALLTKGAPGRVHITSITSSKQVLEYLQKKIPDDKTTIWIAALDNNLDDYSYTVPGLGGVGDLAFGEKEQGCVNQNVLSLPSSGFTPIRLPNLLMMVS